MGKVYFGNSVDKKREIGEASNRQEAWKIINKFLDDHNYKSYYVRVWKRENFYILDVGSWSEFFYVEDSINMLSED